MVLAGVGSALKSVVLAGVGSALKKERLRLGVSLEDISQQTRIPLRFLQAIESEDSATLPGLVFTRNFVRQFAAAVNLDPEPLVAAIPKPDIENAPMPDPPERPKYRRPVNWTRVAVTAASLVVVAGTSTYIWLHPNLLQRANAASVQVAAKTTPPPERTVTTDVPADVPIVRVDAPVEPIAQKSSGIPQAETEMTDAVDRAVRVVIRANDKAWVRLVADGKTVFVGIMEGATSRTVQADAAVRLETGNAGAITLQLNGQDLEPIGPAGQVRRVMLTAEGLQPVVTTPPQQPPSSQF